MQKINYGEVVELKMIDPVEGVTPTSDLVVITEDAESGVNYAFGFDIVLHKDGIPEGEQINVSRMSDFTGGQAVHLMGEWFKQRGINVEAKGNDRKTFFLEFPMEALNSVLLRKVVSLHVANQVAGFPGAADQIEENDSIEVNTADLPFGRLSMAWSSNGIAPLGDYMFFGTDAKDARIYAFALILFPNEEVKKKDKHFDLTAMTKIVIDAVHGQLMTQWRERNGVEDLNYSVHENDVMLMINTALLQAGVTDTNLARLPNPIDTPFATIEFVPQPTSIVSMADLPNRTISTASLIDGQITDHYMKITRKDVIIRYDESIIIDKLAQALNKELGEKFGKLVGYHEMGYRDTNPDWLDAACAIHTVFSGCYNRPAYEFRENTDFHLFSAVTERNPGGPQPASPAKKGAPRLMFDMFLKNGLAFQIKYDNEYKAKRHGLYGFIGFNGEQRAFAIGDARGARSLRARYLHLVDRSEILALLEEGLADVQKQFDINSMIDLISLQWSDFIPEQK